MNWKNTFILGAISTVLSALACIVYAQIYTGALVVNYDKVTGVSQFISASAVGCFLISLGYMLVIKWKGDQLTGWLNIFYGVVSFASIAGVFGFNLPLEVQSPELFPGMVVPMHFFPLLSVLLIYPFFKGRINKITTG